MRLWFWDMVQMQMYDPYVTEEITVRDLCTHRSGLGLGGGDLMFFPEGSNFTMDQIIHNVRFIKQHDSFRSSLEYNNIAFMIAGEIIHRVSGMSWDEFITKRILEPVGMTHSYSSYNRVTDRSNIIDAHAPVDGKIKAIPHDWSPLANAAGGIMSNIEDMAKWAQFLIDGGVTTDGKRLVSERQMIELWNLQIPTPVYPGNAYNTNFNGYALGWFVNDVKGHKQVSHTGGLIGTVTQFTLIPDMKLGIIVLTNQQSGAAFTVITNTIKDSYLDYSDRNWVDRIKKSMDANAHRNDSIVKSVYAQSAKEKMTPTFKENIQGTYDDNWFGNVTIEKTKGVLHITTSNKNLKGIVLPYNDKKWIARWDNRSYDADAFLHFTFDKDGKIEGMKMSPISSATDFSFDFEDLDFVKIK